MASCSCTVFISAPMRRRGSSATRKRARASCFCTAARSIGSGDACGNAGTRSSRCKSISRTAARKLKSRLPKASNCTTSAKRSHAKPCGGKSSAHSKIETVDYDSGTRRGRAQSDRKRTHPGDAAQERAWSASRPRHHALDGRMKSPRTNPEPARRRKHALLIDQPLTIERVEDPRHETRGVKQRARHVTRISTLGRLDRDRKLESRVEKMLGNHRAPEYRRIYGDLPLELSQL